MAAEDVALKVQPVDLPSQCTQHPLEVTVPKSLSIAGLKEQLSELLKLSADHMIMNSDGEEWPVEGCIKQMCANHSGDELAVEVFMKDMKVESSNVTVGKSACKPAAVTVPQEARSSNDRDADGGAQDSGGVENTVAHILKLHLKPMIPAQANKKAAKSWLKTLLPENMQHVVHNVACMGDGRVLKVHLGELRAQEAQDLVVAPFTAVARVDVLIEKERVAQRAMDSTVKEQKVAQKRMVGDVRRTGDVVDKLATLHGEGGKGSKRRRLARKLTKTFRTAQKVAADGLREAADSDSGESASEE